MKLNKINIVLFLVVLILLSGCSTVEPVKTNPVVEAPKEKIILAWGEKHQDWTDHLIKEINSKEWSSDIKNHCKKLDVKTCLAQAVSIMSKYESGSFHQIIGCGTLYIKQKIWNLYAT